ncbi:MAG: hypothetical protein J6P37_08410 [Lachnospiraceae bacterium]|nr:hypothetical protein [Lachnospiraceae bacterium]
MEKKKIDVKRIVYTIAMLLLCVVAFVRGVGGGDWWNAAVSCLGFALFPVIVMRYGFKSFLKIPYLIWLLISIPAAAITIHKFYYSAIHRMAFALLVVECVFYGLIIIRIIYSIIKKEIGKEFKKLNPWFFVALAFFFFAAISVNQATWPLFYGIFFISFYLAPNDEKDSETLFLSLADALIISFFLIQSFAFLHRPYDQVRYVGAYTNSNLNGMFYFCAYLAWLGKYIYFQKNNTHKAVRIIHFLFACAMWSFALLTISRSSLMAFVFSTVVFLVTAEVLILRKSFIKGFLLKGICMLCVFLLSFPLVFACVRFIPPLRHHPIWITEYSEDFVHSYDPWNSPKYIDPDEFFGTFIGRFDIENVDEKSSFTTEQKLLKENNASPSGSEADSQNISETAAKYEEKGDMVIRYPDAIIPGTDAKHPAYVRETYKGLEKILGIRKYIYGYFLTHLNLKGHEREYPFVWLFSWYQVLHAHNSYLQIAFCFGIIPGLLFTALSLYGTITPIVLIAKKKEKAEWYLVFIAMAQMGIFVISIVENISFPGKMMFSLFFVTLRPLMRLKKSKDEEKNSN